YCRNSLCIQMLTKSCLLASITCVALPISRIKRGFSIMSAYNSGSFVCRLDENPLNCLGMNSLRVIGGRLGSIVPPYAKSRPAKPWGRPFVVIIIWKSYCLFHIPPDLALIIIETSSSASPCGMLPTPTAVGDEEDGQCDAPPKYMRRTV